MLFFGSVGKKEYILKKLEGKILMRVKGRKKKCKRKMCVVFFGLVDKVVIKEKKALEKIALKLNERKSDNEYCWVYL